MEEIILSAAFISEGILGREKACSKRRHGKFDLLRRSGLRDEKERGIFAQDPAEEGKGEKIAHISYS